MIMPRRFLSLVSLLTSHFDGADCSSVFLWLVGVERRKCGTFNFSSPFAAVGPQDIFAVDQHAGHDQNEDLSHLKV